MKKLILITLMLLALLIPGILAQYNWEATCIENVLVRNRTTSVGIEVIPIEDNITCTYGCDSLRGKCNDPFNPTSQQSNMSLTLFIIVLVMAFGSLVIGFLKKRLSAMFIAFVLFIVLALQSFSFDIVLAGTQFSGLSTVFIGICWLFALISFVAILVGMVSFIRKPKQNYPM